jgi:hypothetical protein
VKIPKEKLESVKIPKGKLESVKIPKGKLESVKIPKGKLESVKIPKGKLESVNIPKGKLESVKIPKGKLESVKIPKGKLESVKIPNGKLESVYQRRTYNNMDKREKVQKDKRRSTKHTYHTKDRATRIALKTGGELRCSGRVSSSCSTSGTRRVNLVTNPVISHE